MQLTARFKIKDIANIISFLNGNHVGRLSTIDMNGFPQVIPMNFVHLMVSSKKFENNNLPSYQCFSNKNNNRFDYSNIANNAYKHVIYMHSHHTGEKISNLNRNPKVGFEADKEICFLPSYYFHPSDASFADTLYISVVIKGTATIVSENIEKAIAMNCMMKKYQPEGKYIELTKDSKSIQHLTVIKIDVDSIDGKYKIGQQWPANYRRYIATKIIEREGLNKAKEILKEMRISVLPNGELEVEDPMNM